MSRLLFAVLVVVYCVDANGAPSSSPASLWVKASYRADFSARQGARREMQAAFGLNLPWERWLAPSLSFRLARTPDTITPHARTGPPRQTVAEASASGQAQRSEPEHPLVSKVPARSSLRSEPDGPKPILNSALARETLGRALRADGSGNAKRRLQALASRARWSAVLPELRLRAARGTDQSLRLAPTISDPYRYTRDGGTDVTLEARASWHLSRLLFTTPEIAIERLRDSRKQRTARLTSQVFKQLFAWQKARLTVQDSDSFPEQRQQAALAALQAELVLNVLTDGWFTTHRADSYARAHAERGAR